MFDACSAVMCTCVYLQTYLDTCDPCRAVHCTRVYLQADLDMCDPCSIAQNFYLLHSKVLHNLRKTIIVHIVLNTVWVLFLKTIMPLFKMMTGLYL